MSATPADHRRHKGNAKGTITRSISTFSKFKSLSLAEYNTAFFDKQVAIIDKADGIFQLHHEALIEADEDLDLDHHETEILDQQAIVFEAKQLLEDLTACKQAWQLAKSIKVALEDLEGAVEGGYGPSQAPQFTLIESEMTKFRSIIASDYVQQHDQIVAVRRELTNKWESVNKIRDLAAAETGAVGVVRRSRDKSPISHGLRTETPIFNGDPLSFSSHKELFTAIIKKNTQLSDAEKKDILLKSMGTTEAVDQAHSAIDSTNTFEEAWRQVCAHYEQHKDLYAKHINALFTRDSFSSSRVDIDRLIRKIDKHVHGLKETKGYSIGQLITAYISGLCGDELSSEWEKFSSTTADPPPLEMFQAFLKQELQRTSMTKVTIKAEPNSHYQADKPRNRAPHQNKQKAASKSVMRVAPAKVCSVCQESHATFSCPTFRAKTVEQRRACVQEHKLCFNCLGERHRSDECKSTKTCTQCHKRHNTLLHFSNPNPAATTPGRSDFSDLSPAVARPGTNAIHDLTSRSTMTATAMVSMQSGGPVQCRRVLLDTGSDLTLITRRFANSLCARRVSSKSIEFNSAQGTGRTLYEVRVTLIGDDRVGCQEERVHITAMW